MPPKQKVIKKKTNNGYKMPDPIAQGEILTDLSKNQWKLGPSIGKGGFGEIYSAQNATDKSKEYKYVVKIEPHSNGPLFVEMHFYMKFGKEPSVEEFRMKTNLKTFGMPICHGHGSHEYKSEKYRFLVLDRLGTDLQKVLLENNKRLPVSTAFKIAIQILYVLEYIHEKEYVHADIKAANILFGTTKDTCNQAYLVDFGLACKYTKDKQFKPNPKKAHDGTIEYLSRDAHKGDDLRCIKRGENSLNSGDMIYCEVEDNVIRGVVAARMRNKNYNVRVTLATDHSICNAECNCPRGKFVCHHMACVILHVHYNLSRTDVSCSWVRQPEKPSTSSAVVPETIFQPVDDADLLEVEAVESFREDLRAIDHNSGLLWLMTDPPEAEDEFLVPSVESILYCKDYVCAEDKIEYLKHSLQLEPAKIISIAATTVGQRDNSAWLIARKHRLTASNFGEVLGACRRNSFPKSLFDRLKVQTRRGDLEILGYNLIHWLSGFLPWEKKTDPNAVHASKTECMDNLKTFMDKCFGTMKPPDALMEYLEYILTLEHDTIPCYEKIRKIFIKQIEAVGDSLNEPLEFNLQNQKTSGRKSLKRKSSSRLSFSIKKQKVVTSKAKAKKTVSKEINNVKETKKTKSKSKINIEKENGVIYDGFTPEMRAVMEKKLAKTKVRKGKATTKNGITVKTASEIQEANITKRAKKDESSMSKSSSITLSSSTANTSTSTRTASTRTLRTLKPMSY